MTHPRLTSGLSKRDETKFIQLEDDAELAQWLIRALKQRHDFTIERADDGLLADQRLRYGEFDAVIFDTGLWKMDGRACAIR